jgi:hypothetical protein
MLPWIAVGPLPHTSGAALRLRSTASNMKEGLPASLNLRHVLLWVLAYAFWLVATAACVAAVIQVRSMVNVLWIILGGDRYSLGLVNQVILLLGGLVGFIYVMLLESYYRESITLGKQRPEAEDEISGQTPALRPSRLPRWVTGGGLDALLRRFVITTAVPLGIIVLSLAIVDVAVRGLQ